jgi:hypothetical protein
MLVLEDTTMVLGTSQPKSSGTAIRRRSFGVITFLTVLAVAAGSLVRVDVAQSAEGEFSVVAPQGFGDRQNSWAWSMQWWNGYLYVGTARATACVADAALEYAFPFLDAYPPDDPAVECTPEPEDLPLQAEIWRGRPYQGWERVYRAPNDVPIPGTSPQKFTSRDIGYRGMTVFREADGTEALYVGAVSGRALGYNVPPRILRSTDGVNFEALPQEPGTVLGDFPLGSYRGLTTYKGKLYVIGGTLQGSGRLLEATDPRGGNDNFREVGPSGVEISAIMPYDGELYIGTRDYVNGYRVIKTDASGDLPYEYTEVVGPGAYLPVPNQEVLSMEVFENRLYVGANGFRYEPDVSLPAELIRINPDDSWDIVAGDPRDTPTGPKASISGFRSGFGNAYNVHMWRMETFDGELYVGTFDNSTEKRVDGNLPPDVIANLGFDLFRSADGETFEPITTTGFGDRFNSGVRSLEATPYGLFLGSANQYFGVKVYHFAPEGFVEGYTVFLPSVSNAVSAP